MRAVVVTGASSGIGEAGAIALSRAGFTIYAGVRNDADAKRLGAYPGVVPLAMDVTDGQTLAAAAERARADGLPLAGLVNNAGIALGGPVESLPLDQWRHQFEVNLFGAIAATQAFLPLLRRDRGRVIFVGSVSGRVAFPYIAPYSTSKFALRALADALRVELRPAGVAVCLIEPGSVKTAIWSKARATRDEMLARLRDDMPAYYRDAIETVVRGIEGEERGGMPVARVTDAIRSALTDPRPKAHRIIGTSAAIASVLALLPAALHDRFLRATMRLP